MSHLSVLVPSMAAPPRRREPRQACELFYKADHPRAIDRYIDFFGDRLRRVEEEVPADWGPDR